MLSPGISVKRRHGGAGFALVCGCKDAKSVSVSPTVSASPSGAGTSMTTETRRGGGRTTNPSASTITDTLTSASSSSFVWEDAVAEFDCGEELDGPADTQSFSGLLRELSELEQSVASWGRNSHRLDMKLSTPVQDRVDKKLSTPPQDRVDKKPSTPPRESRTVATKSGGDLTRGNRSGGGIVQASLLDGRVEVGLDGSVAVVKQSEDPLGDFRRSMAQMVVEHGIVAGAELREMLRRFLSLNAPHHHGVILRAFAEVWDAVFAASYEDDYGDPVALAAVPVEKYPRREPSPGRPPVPSTPPRHHHNRSPSAWRV